MFITQKKVNFLTRFFRMQDFLFLAKSISIFTMLAYIQFYVILFYENISLFQYSVVEIRTFSHVYTGTRIGLCRKPTNKVTILFKCYLKYFD